MITKIIKQAEYIIKIWRTEQWKEKDYTDQEKQNDMWSMWWNRKIFQH